ncbi:MAG: hypothetical protein QF535_23300, partial [Anaerolineales bacterium]|nr:hypothetical protein [Anaerolineales bacterium]
VATGTGIQDSTSGVLTSGDGDITEGTSFVDPVYEYLTGLGFGVTPQSITQTHVQDFLTSGFTLDSLATALGTTPSQLQAIADYSPAAQTQTGLQTYLSTLGYGTSPKTVTKEDVTSFIGQEDFTLADIAAELNVSEDLLNQIYNYVPATATSSTPLETYLIEKGYGGAGQVVSQADAAEFLSSSDFTVDQIAQGLGLTVADIENAAQYGDATATSTELTPLQNYLIDQGFGGAGRTITAADVNGWKDALAAQDTDYTLEDIASALGLTVSDLDAVEQYAGTTATSTGLTSLQNYLIGMNFGGAGRAVTAADIEAFTGSDFNLEDIASALGLTVTDLNAIGASTSSSIGLTPLQNYLVGMNFGGAGRTITTADVEAFGDSDFTLDQIASALGLTVNDLNAVTATAVDSTGLSGVQNYLMDMNFGGAGRTITTADVEAFK